MRRNAPDMHRMGDESGLRGPREFLSHFSLRTSDLARTAAGTLLTAAAAVGLFCSPTLQTLFQYDRACVAAGELWRMLTCHWTHWSAEHMVWDVVTFVVLGTMCERIHRGAWATCILLASLAIPVMLAAACPQVESYRGLSGLDAALFALLATMLARRHHAAGNSRAAITCGVALVALAAKVTFEAVTGTAIFVSEAGGATPIALAHLVGGAMGVLSAIWYLPATAQDHGSGGHARGAPFISGEQS